MAVLASQACHTIANTSCDRSRGRRTSSSCNERDTQEAIARNLSHCAAPPATPRELVSSCNGVTDTRPNAARRLCRWRVTGRGDSSAPPLAGRIVALHNERLSPYCNNGPLRVGPRMALNKAGYWHALDELARSQFRVLGAALAVDKAEQCRLRGRLGGGEMLALEGGSEERS